MTTGSEVFTKPTGSGVVTTTTGSEVFITTTGSQVVTTTTENEVFTDAPYEREVEIFMRVISVVAHPIILFGVFSNITNIIVFFRAGVKNSVNICLLALSISDLLHLILSTPQVATVTIKHFQPDWPWPFDYTVTRELFYWPASTFYDMSAFFSVCLAATRCACVAMPLKFKSFMTWKRSLAILCCLAACAVILRAPLLCSMKIGYRRNAANETEAYLLFAIDRDFYEEFTRVNDLLNRGIISWVLFIIVVLCTTVLIFKLYKAAKFRKTSTITKALAENLTLVTRDSASSNSTLTSQSTKLSARNIKVVQSVVLVSLIFILSQVPYLSYSLARLLNSEFTYIGRMGNLLRIAAYTSTTCGYINASVNIIIYYNYHTKYRQIFRLFFRLDKK